ncbi:hypothetical protein, partial [Rhodobaculum claviforme]|uniref:hypothetical protein n=1 Tax=Rhodobaculum claviforme TaxID=1549854 RepID=UPI001F5CDF73
MTPPRPALYLARAGYRRRRAMDAARLLPFVGIFLLLLPRLWGEGAVDAPPGAATAREGVYLFVVWAGLVVAAAVLARWLRPVAEGAAGDEIAAEPVAGGRSSAVGPSVGTGSVTAPPDAPTD